MKNNKKIAKSSKNGKIKSFLLFLLLATFFWMLTKFSKEYSTSLKPTIDYVNIPNQFTLLSENPKTLSFDVTGNGFSFLFFKFKKPAIKIDVEKYFVKENLSSVIPESDLLKIMASQLDQNVKVKNSYTKNLHIKLDKNSSKKVLVVLNSQITYEKGYNLIGKINLIPDSITVSGPSRYIDTLEYVKTVVLQKEDLKTSISKNIPLQLQEFITTSTQEVKLTLQVEEFTQKQLTIPIQLINVEEGTEVTILPEVLNLSFNVSIQEFKNISKKDFTIICDYAKRDEQTNTIALSITKQPSNILQVEMEPQQVEYLIFK